MSKTRLFDLQWNNARIPSLGNDERNRTRTAEGTHYFNGIVTLSNGTVYETLHELLTHIRAYGHYKLVYQDDGEVIESPTADKSIAPLPRRTGTKA